MKNRERSRRFRRFVDRSFVSDLSISRCDCWRPICRARTSLERFCYARSVRARSAEQARRRFIIRWHSPYSSHSAEVILAPPTYRSAGAGHKPQLDSGLYRSIRRARR